MIKTLISGLCCFVLALTFTVAYTEGRADGVTVTQETAKNTPGCIGKHEYSNITRGIGKDTIASYVDAKGHYEGHGPELYSWSWRACWALGVKRVWCYFNRIDGLMRKKNVKHV